MICILEAAKSDFAGKFPKNEGADLTSRFVYVIVSNQTPLHYPLPSDFVPMNSWNRSLPLGKLGYRLVSSFHELDVHLAKPEFALFEKVDIKIGTKVSSNLSGVGELFSGQLPFLEESGS